MTKLSRTAALALLIEQPAALAEALNRLDALLGKNESSAWAFEEAISHDDLSIILAHCRATSNGIILHALPAKSRSTSN